MLNSFTRALPPTEPTRVWMPTPVMRISPTPSPGASTTVAPARFNALSTLRLSGLAAFELITTTRCRFDASLISPRRWNPQAESRAATSSSNAVLANPESRIPKFMISSYDNIHDLARHDDDLLHRLAFDELRRARIGERSLLDFFARSVHRHFDLSAQLAVDLHGES